MIQNCQTQTDHDGSFLPQKWIIFFKKLSHFGLGEPYLYMKDRKIYHVYPRGVRRGNLFECGKQHDMFQFLAGKYALELDIDLIVLVQMTNHYHAIIEGEILAKSEFLKKVHWAYAKSYNTSQGFSGHAFESSCKGREIVTDGSLAHTARYDFLNAVMAGMAASPGDHLYSTYKATIGEAPLPPGVRPERLLQCFSTDMAEAKVLLKKYVECLTPSHPIVREALRHWDEISPPTAKSRNCRRIVEFAALTSAAISAGSSGFELNGTLLFNKTELQLVGMKTIAGATGSMMSAILGIPTPTVNRLLRRIKNILVRTEATQQKLSEHIERILLPSTAAIGVNSR